MRGVYIALLATVTLSAQATSTWVSPGRDGKLTYRTDPRGNRIPDFSYAGYEGGGVAIPRVRAVKTLKPMAGDNTAQIQAALDEVSKMPIGRDGFRGALELAPGDYEVAGQLKIGASGVVLRGAASDGASATTIHITGAPHRFLDIAGSGTWQPDGSPAAITDAYVPVNALSFTVQSAAGFKAGDAILIQRPVTDAWVHFMGMDTLERNGQKQTWMKAGTIINTDRRIASIKGNTITLDVPLSDSLDAQFAEPGPTGPGLRRAGPSGPAATIVKYTFPGRIDHVGLESLKVVAPAQDKPISEAQYTLLRMNALSDGWVRDVVSQDTQNTTTFGSTTRRLTIERVRVIHTMPFTAPAAPADFAISGTQTLIDRCSEQGAGVWPIVTQEGTTGPNAIVHFSAETAGVAPHQRWATSLLLDSSTFTNGTEKRPNVAWSNREYAGSGHGWAVGWAVAWNVKGDYLLIQQPPGAKNWCIGCTGQPPTILWHGGKIPIPQIPSETWEAPGVEVNPPSLYLAQLKDRLGSAAVKNIGYDASR